MIYLYIFAALFACYLITGIIYLKFFDDGKIGGWVAMCLDSRHGFPIPACILVVAMA